MIELARAIVVKGENSVPEVGEVVAGNSLAGIALMVDGRERVRAVVAADLLQDPNGACAGPITDQVIELASTIVVKGENLVPDVGKVVGADPLAGVALMVDRCKRVRAVAVVELFQNPNGACAGPVARQMIELASAIVIKGENSVPKVGKVVAGDPLSGLLMVDRCECVCAVIGADLLQNPNVPVPGR